MTAQTPQISLQTSLEKQLGPIVERLWMLPGAAGARGTAESLRTGTCGTAGPLRAGAQAFSREQALRQVQALEAELDAALAPVQAAPDAFVLLH